MGIFEKMAIGWGEVEPVIMANIALEMCFMMEGEHGICKTTLCKELSKMYGEDVFRHYDATKDDLVSIASVPIPEELAKGNLVFSKHNRSAWDALFIVIDEVSRANKESQNLLLELMEERTLFGQPLKYKQLIATRNPSGYASNFELDEALLDRFSVVVPIPNMQKSTAKTVKEVIKINLGKRINGNGNGKLNIPEVKKLVQDIKDQYNACMSDLQILDVVTT